MKLRPVFALVSLALLALFAAASLLPSAPSRADAPADTLVTFNKDIAPVLFSQCSSCHRPGEVAPFSLLTYDDAKKRARQIALVTEKRIMPPWKPEPGFGRFEGARHLTDAQIALFVKWAASGAKEGRKSDLPPPPKFTEGWAMGKPDLILRMPKAFTIPADGVDVNRSFVVPLHLPGDRHVRAAEFRPGNRRVVHHATVMLDTSGKARQLEIEQGGAGGGYKSFGGPGFLPVGGLSGYVPGETPRPVRPEVVGTLPKDVDLVFGMHYHPSGKPETDQSEIGLYFTDKPGTRVGSIVLMGVLHVDIAPGDASHFEETSFTLPTDVDVTGIGPHMHFIGKTTHFWADLPDGTTKQLIKINHWDFNWGGTYTYVEPVHLPKGATIHGVWTFDNSADNPRNPSHPPKRVTYGESTTDEMGGAWINVIVDKQTDNLAVWIANLGHLAKASVTPARKDDKTKDGALVPAAGNMSPPSDGPSPLGVAVQLAQIDATVAALLAAVQYPAATWAVVWLGLAVLVFLAALLFPVRTTRAADALRARPGRCFGRGLLALAIALPVTLALLFSPNFAVRGVGFALAVILCVVSLVGAGGLIWRVCRSRAPLAFFAACALFSLAVCVPVLGWFVVAPVSLILTVGAGLAAVGKSEETKQQSDKKDKRMNFLAVGGESPSFHLRGNAL